MISSRNFTDYGSLYVPVFENNDIENPKKKETFGCLAAVDPMTGLTPACKLLEPVKFERDDEDWLQDLGGSATIFSEVMNIAKNLLGAGVLSMSGGIAMYANSPWGVLSSSFEVVIQAMIFGYFCVLIAKVCELTTSKTIRECWERTMGKKFAVAIVVVIGLNPLQGTLAYSAILSQTFKSLCETIGISLTHIESLLIVTVVGLLPLCLMKNIHALAPFSMLGTSSILLTAVGMICRCYDGSYQPGGIYYDDLPVNMRPHFGTEHHIFSPKAIPLVCMIFEAYVMHYNSPRFYMELKDRSIPRFSWCVGGAFGLSALVYVAIASAGFLTFGGNSDNYILNNYSPRDPLATACRLLVGISTLTTYPMGKFSTWMLDHLMHGANALTQMQTIVVSSSI
jgi:amino acid permease